MNRIHIRRFLIVTGSMGFVSLIVSTLAIFASRPDILVSILMATMLVGSVLNVSVGLMPVEVPEEDFQSLQKLVQAGQQERNPDLQPARLWHSDTSPSDQVFPAGFFDADGDSFFEDLMRGEDNKK